ncbi:MAG: class I SAM-dependent methyltransferase [Candidatus Sungbacteria bacterium]|uniref:Class I SAM-dependent methyltransferase n=1 Tax=Candidatus Sungiibacteriota bacterium TaxID=2750080 RepID=A0A931SE81_9BACT|nr:class I SAM-dependent methyltransferase [Candidatus Sungbacteria bacterium]
MLPQVPPEHYRALPYLGADRWVSYGNQVREVLRLQPERVLEIGVGNGIVRDALKNLGYQVTALDIDAELRPDIAASVVRMPISENAFDVVLAAEVLEHLPFTELDEALGEIWRVTKRHVYITLPHAGAVIDVSIKLPLLPRFRLFFKVPFFWKRHIFNGEHYWELGKKGFPVSRVKTAIKRAGFVISKAGIDPADPAHYFFSLIKHGKNPGNR